MSSFMRKVWPDHGLIEEKRLFLDHKVVEHLHLNRSE